MNRFLAMAIFGAVKAVRERWPQSRLIGRAYQATKNWYEAGWPLLAGDRAYVPSLVQDARWDQNYITRREMLRRMRYWSQNSPLLESILSVGERYTVGPAGLHVAFYSVEDDADTDEKGDPWYEAAEQVVKEWFRDCGWNSESMETLLKVGYRCQKVDGDVFLIKTRKRGKLQIDNQTLNVNKPCLQMVEGHRVETPWMRWQDEGRSVMDGVEFTTVKNNGRDMLSKTGYWIREGFGAVETEAAWTMIPIDSVLHIFSPHRVNQFRGLSDFYAIENELGRLEELLRMELKAQDSQSDWAVLVKNAAGQFNPIDPKLQAVAVARNQNQPTSQTDAQKLQSVVEMYRKTYGGNTRAFKQGEDAQMLAPNRPAEATLQLWEFLVNSVCAGCHSPRCLVFGKISAASAKAQGTEVRAELDAADANYKGEFQKWKHTVRDAVIYFMEWAIKNDPRVADPPDNWRNCIHIQPPQACNVDVGRNTQADIMMLAAGASDYDLLLGPQGLSFNTVARKLSRQQRKLKQLNVEVTLPALLAGQIPLDGKGGEPKPEPEHAEA
jgi:capsid protein